MTVTSTAPDAWAGVTAVMELSLATVKEEVAVPPKVTAVAPVRLEPEIVTGVPPAGGQESRRDAIKEWGISDKSHRDRVAHRYRGERVTVTRRITGLPSTVTVPRE